MSSPSRPAHKYVDIDDEDDSFTRPPTVNTQPFVADSAAYAQLLDLGFNQNAIFRGLFFTGNKSVELAAAWIIEHENDPLVNSPIADDVSLQQPPPVINADADDESDPSMLVAPSDQSGLPSSSASTTSPARQGSKSKHRGNIGTVSAQQPAEVEELEDSDDDLAGGNRRRALRPNDPKMVFVVNYSLRMGVGKIASQVAHAAVLLYQQLQERERDIETLFRWHEIGMKKIVLKSVPRRARDSPQPASVTTSTSATSAVSASSDASSDVVVVEKPAQDGTAVLRELHAAAIRAKLPIALVADAGRTQIDPGSITVLGIFGPANRVDQITGHLGLL